MYKQGKLYSFAATGYLYSLIIVDLCRKLTGSNVDSIRNLVYIFFFVLLLLDMYKSKHLKPMLSIAILTLIIFGFSMLLNPGYSEIYSSSVILFISRLWPAFYIGRYTEDWDALSKWTLLFSPIALVYAVSLFIVPDLAGGEAYATIASNLAFVTLISLFACIHHKWLIVLPIVLICLVPVFFYGTRAFFVGVFVSMFLAYLIKMKKKSRKKSFVWLFIVFMIFIILGDVILELLYEWFPNSRTLGIMVKGEFMNDSNRSDFYEKILAYLIENPFSMLGLIGDRIYLSGPYDSTDTILSMFSHNCCLELCMNFGLFLGVILNIYFLKKLYFSFKKSLMDKKTVNYIYVLFLGAGFVNMMVSASYMGSYIPWLLMGLAFCICSSNYKKKRVNINVSYV